MYVDISARKLWRSLSDAANCGVRSGSTLFSYVQKFDSRLILVRCMLIFLQENCGDPYQTPLIVVSALGLHCFPTSKNLTLDLYWLGKGLLLIHVVN